MKKIAFLIFMTLFKILLRAQGSMVCLQLSGIRCWLDHRENLVGVAVSKKVIMKFRKSQKICQMSFLPPET